MERRKKFILESKFKSSVTTFLESHGCLLAHFNSKDWPDHLVVPPAPLPIFFIEYKRHSNNKYKATDGQLEKIKEIKEKGKVAILLHSDEDWERLLRPLADPTYIRKTKLVNKTKAMAKTKARKAPRPRNTRLYND